MSSGKESYPPFKYQVALGLVPGFSSFRKFGYNADIDTGTEDVWSAGGVKVWPTSAGVATVVSTSTADDASPAGTGAWTVRFEGLDSSFNEITEDFTLDGTTPVVGTKSFYRIHRGYVLTAGTGQVNAGQITATVGGNVQSAIPIAVGQSQQCHYTVPAGYTLLIDEYAVACGKETTGDQVVVLGQIRLNAGANNESWRSITAVAIYEDVWVNDATVTVVPEKTDMRVQVQSDFTNVEVNAVFSGFLVSSGTIARL